MPLTMRPSLPRRLGDPTLMARVAPVEMFSRQDRQAVSAPEVGLLNTRLHPFCAPATAGRPFQIPHFTLIALIHSDSPRFTSRLLYTRRVRQRHAGFALIALIRLHELLRAKHEISLCLRVFV
jgi:hypothetical protein